MQNVKWCAAASVVASLPPRRHVGASAGLFVLGWALAAAPSLAAEPVAIQQRAADMVALAGGERIAGMFASAPTEGMVTLYASRDWLRKHQAAFYRKFAAGEEDRRKEALEQYRQRIADWRERRTEPKILKLFIGRSLRDVESQIEQLEKGDKPPEPSQLVVIEAPAKQVRNFYAQPQATRRLLALAWEAQLEGAEDLPVNELTERLKKQGVDVEHAWPDLSDRFNVVPLTPRQWAAKVALVEFEIVGKPHFQGTGGVLLEDDGDGNRPPLADLVGGLLQDQLGDALGDLLNPAEGRERAGGGSKQQAAVDKALASAADKKSTGVRITNLDQDLARHRVTVNDAFYAFMPDGAWQAIWQQSSTIDTNEAKDLGEDQLAADPQVAEIMQTLKGLGLDANQDLLKSALRFGGATQKAMQATDHDFADYLLSHTRRLIGPPVVVPDAKP
ncbi:MAG TPA: hypothetical protein VFI31_06235 [Pirellulales bacterium]|nr:hypothetical protein [Pirellulales bacterium]